MHVSSTQVEVNNDVNLCVRACVHVRQACKHKQYKEYKRKRGEKAQVKQKKQSGEVPGLMGQDESAHQLTAGRLRND